jgi:glutamyl-tRNA synthetase
MGTGLKKRRKDYINASQIIDSITYYYDELYQPEYEFCFDNQLSTNIITAFKATYDVNDDNNQWFNKLKDFASELGIAAEMSDYKAEPDRYIGNISDLAEVLRVATTGHKNTPDLWSIMQIMGYQKVISRLDQALGYLKGSV